MSNGIIRSSGELIKQEVLNPLVRFTANKREGKLLLRCIRLNLKDPESTITIHRLRDQVFFHRPTVQQEGQKKGKSVGFSGAVGNEGATALSILLGLSLGELKRNRVIFIDGRFDRKNFGIYTEMFGLTKTASGHGNGSGFFQFYTTKNRNLCFLTPSAQIDPMEFFSNEELGSLIGELRESFDYVVFDMPPLLKSSETRMLIPHLDLFFLICTSRKTLTSDVERCKRTVAEAGSSISGVILNKQRVPFWSWFFGKEAFF